MDQIKQTLKKITGSDSMSGNIPSSMSQGNLSQIINESNANHLSTSNIVSTSTERQISSTYKQLNTNEKVAELVKDYVKLDKSYRMKHESLKTLYEAYMQLYQKTKDQELKNLRVATKPQCATGACPTNTCSTGTCGQVCPTNNCPIACPTGNCQYKPQIQAIDNKYQDTLNTIHNEMKNNNTQLYQERVNVLNRIRETPDLCPKRRDQVCGQLLDIFKAPPMSSKTQSQQSSTTQTISSENKYKNSNPQTPISVKDLDESYFQRHNELMNVYKAYQNLFKKTLNYKDELDQYKNLDTSSSITAGQMSKLVEDQKFVMNMIGKMQDELANRNIINNSEKVPVTPVANIPQNIDYFNNNARSQIKTIITREPDITQSAKQQIERLIRNPATTKSVENCGCNKQFVQNGGKLIVLKNNNFNISRYKTNNKINKPSNKTSNKNKNKTRKHK
jgi:hypothetical protein